MKVSRRKLLQVLPVAAAQASAQAQPPASADPDLENARRSLQASARAVRQVMLPQATEPASKFIPRS